MKKLYSVCRRLNLRYDPSRSVQLVTPLYRQPYRPVASRTPWSIAALRSTVPVASKNSEIGITPVLYILRDHRSAFPIMKYFFLWRFFFTLTNSVDPDEMPHHVAFHLGLHCLSKYRVPV